MMALVTLVKTLSSRAIYTSDDFVKKFGLCLKRDINKTFVELLNLLCEIDESDFPNARIIAERLIENESREVKSVAYEAIGDSYRLDGNHNKAIESYKSALSLFDQDEWATRCFMCLYNWLDLIYVKGDVNKVIDELDNIIFALPENSFNLYYVYMLSMNIYRNLSEYDKALEYAEKQLKLASRMGSPRKRCQSHYNMAEVYVHIDTKQADINIAKAKEIADELKSEKLYSRIGFAQTENALEKKDYASTIELGEIAFERLKKANYYTGCARISTSLAEAHYQLGNYQKAYDCALFAINRYSTIGSYPYERVRTLAVLLMAAKELGILEEARKIDDIKNIAFLEQYKNVDKYKQIINEILEKGGK